MVVDEGRRHQPNGALEHVGLRPTERRRSLPRNDVQVQVDLLLVEVLDALDLPSAHVGAAEPASPTSSATSNCPTSSSRRIVPGAGHALWFDDLAPTATAIRTFPTPT